MSDRIGRIALRQEGGNWTAYYAFPDTMEGAVFLGSIKLAFLKGHPERKQIFMDLMRDCLADIIEEKTGVRPIWGGAELAPEHEKAGSA